MKTIHDLFDDRQGLGAGLLRGQDVVVQGAEIRLADSVRRFGRRWKGALGAKFVLRDIFSLSMRGTSQDSSIFQMDPENKCYPLPRDHDFAARHGGGSAHRTYARRWGTVSIGGDGLNESRPLIWPGPLQE